MVTKTQEEFDAMSHEERKAHFAAEEKIVFGNDVKHRKGVPIEQGVGSAGHETANHFTAILKYQGDEAHQDALAEIWKRDPDRAKKLALPRPRAKAA